MLIYSPPFSRSEPPPRFKSGIPEGLWEGVLLFPMDTSHFQRNGPASLASQPFWKAFIRVYPLSPCKGWSSLMASVFPPSTRPHEHHQYMPQSILRELCLPSTTVPSQGDFPSPDYTPISSPAILILSRLQQPIIHHGGALLGFIAIQTFEQTMQNIDKNWVPLQCRYIATTPGQLHTVGLSTSLSHE